MEVLTDSKVNRQSLSIEQVDRILRDELDKFEELRSGIDWQARSDYRAIYEDRMQRINLLEQNPLLISAWKEWYQEHPWTFLDHWGYTTDPRLTNQGKRSNVPFVLFPRQIEYLQWLFERYRESEAGCVVKSRDMGVTWLSTGFMTSMWLFVPGFVGGLGSRVEDLVDQTNDPESMFQRILHQLQYTPRFLWPEGLIWREGKPAPNSYAHMRMENPGLGSFLIGEAGKNIGRGRRTSMYIVDESAFVENQMAVDKSLSNNTDCKIDVSTFNGAGNPFFEKSERFKGTRRRFDFDWHDDPRKNEHWYEKQQIENDPTVVAQEVDRDPYASQGDSFIEAKWILDSIDAHEVLFFDPMYTRTLTWDPSDGNDPNALSERVGNVFENLEARKIDIVGGEAWTLESIATFNPDVFVYDAEGMGAPAMKLMLKGKNFKMMVIPFYGSGGVLYPEGRFGTDTEDIVFDLQDTEGIQLNKDRLENLRAQVWWWMRQRFWRTSVEVNRVKNGKARGPFRNDQLISISSKCKDLEQFKAEVSIPKKMESAKGKIKVESKKEMASRGVKSTNLADVVMMSEAGLHPYNSHKKAKSRSRFRNRQRILPTYL